MTHLYSLNSTFICGISFSSFLYASDISFSKIEEQMLLNPPASGGHTDEVIIYSNVRNRTVNQALDQQFHRIENMMFINTVVESDSGDYSLTDDECD